MKKIALISFTCISLVSMSAFADTLKTGIAQCAKVEDSLARLVCFDKLAKRADTFLAKKQTSVAAATPGVSPTSTTAPAPVVNKEDTFGAEYLTKTNTTEDDSEVVFVVKKLKEDRYGKLHFLFKNGQQWKQSDSKFFKVKVGDSLLLKKGFMGAVYLKKNNPDSNKRIRVKRLK